jgi:hypothetical protein
MENIIIYILCHNELKLNESYNIYNKYLWAKPILMKYQNYTFENAFWKQLYEIQNEWITFNMVGVLSFSSYQKINLDKIDNFIKNRLYLSFSYYNFFNTNNIMPSINTSIHPYYNEIWFNTINELKLFNITESFCNYWMCKPQLMINFINWYNDLLLPILINNKYIFENANYYKSNNLLNEKELIKIWNKPYYPNLPFILERINKCFFITFYSCVCFFYENKIKKYYESINIKTFIIINNNDIYDIVKIYNYNPIIIIDSNINNNIINELENIKIPIFYYIDNNYKNIINKLNMYFLFETKILYNKFNKYCTNNNYIIINDNYDYYKLILSYSPRLDININKKMLLQIKKKSYKY